jgi:hypothetical protein
MKTILLSFKVEAELDEFWTEKSIAHMQREIEGTLQNMLAREYGSIAKVKVDELEAHGIRDVINVIKIEEGSKINV